jgi:glycosyltransferase involved in cell wall biosynthesis
MSISDRNVKPLVSVLMPVYNVENFIAKAIESVLSQTLKNLEFIIIDDGSTDDSKNIIGEYQKNDCRIKFISRENKGIVYTRNELLNMASAAYFAIMDSDDISNPERLAEQFHFLKNNTEYLVVSCRDLLIDPDDDPIMIINNSFEHEEIDKANLSLTSFQTLNAYMAVTESVKKIGGYRHEVLYAEDRDLFLRLAEIGKVKVLPKVLYQYRQHLNSTCVEKADELNMYVSKVIIDAFERRNMEFNAAKLEPKNPVTIKKEGYYFTVWAWLALESNYLKTARKYAVKQLVKQPISYNAWLLMYCVIRNHFKNLFQNK